jgi:molybdopterin converting factor subunit 1
MINAEQLVSIRLFARARDLAGADRVTLRVPAGATVGEVRRRLAAERPALAGLVERSAVAIKDAFAEDSETVPVDAEMALLPPVSGG